MREGGGGRKGGREGLGREGGRERERVGQGDANGVGVRGEERTISPTMPSTNMILAYLAHVAPDAPKRPSMHVKGS